MTETPVEISPTATAHEETDVNVRALNTFLMWLVGSLAVIAMLVFWQYRRFEAQARANDPPPSPRAEERRPIPGPGLLVDEVSANVEFTARQNASVLETGWVSQEEKIVRIPVAQAMEAVVKNGLPQWPAATSSADAATPPVKPTTP